MNGLSDSLTIGILLTLIFGAVAFYLYSKLSQSEKRIGLLENLLLTLKMSTEASLEGPDRVEVVSGPVPLSREDVEEEDYEEMLKEIPAGTSGAPAPGAEASSASSSGTVTPNVAAAASSANEEQEEEALLRAMEAIPVPAQVQAQAQTTSDSIKVTPNYESMNVKELQALARQKGFSSVPQRKRELIDLLKTAHTPLTPAEGELEGATIEQGFEVSLN